MTMFAPSFMKIYGSMETYFWEIDMYDRVTQYDEKLQTCKIHILNKEALDEIAFGMET